MATRAHLYPCAPAVSHLTGVDVIATIHFIGGEKGGVGKSLVSRLLAQYLIDRNLPFMGFDSDRSHGALLRFYAAYASPVVIDRYESLDAVVETAAADPQRRCLVDLAAQTHQPLVKWMDESGMIELAAELGVQIRYWHVMDAGKDSTDLLKTLLDRFGAQLAYVLVLNELRGDDFGVLDRSGEKERALGFGAQLLSLPRLHDTAMTRIDAHSASFWAAANSADKSITGLGMLDRQRVKIWLKKVYEGFDLLGI